MGVSDNEGRGKRAGEAIGIDGNAGTPAGDLQGILESAARLGVEMDEEEALQYQVGALICTMDEAARAEVINVVDNFFREKSAAVPSIRHYLDESQEREE